jgi:hypothetical protein
MPNKSAHPAAVAAFVFFLTSAPAYAYIDPGIGSMILQGLIGAVAGGLFLMRAWWGRIASFLPGARKSAEEPASAPETTAQ